MPDKLLIGTHTLSAVCYDPRANPSPVVHVKVTVVPAAAAAGGGTGDRAADEIAAEKGVLESEATGRTYMYV